MRKLLFESVFRRPLTERAPSPDDAAVAELATALGQAAPRPLCVRLDCQKIETAGVSRFRGVAAGLAVLRAWHEAPR